MVESRRVKILSKKPHGSFLLANIQRHSYNDVLLHCFSSSSATSSKSPKIPQGKPVFIPSHRLILSTISPLLGSLLAQAEGPEPDHPIVISLPDTDPQVLSFLLDFAYCGKTTVPLKHLDGISETSKRLRIKYLENAIVKVERAPIEAPLAVLKPIKAPTPPTTTTSSSSSSNNNIPANTQHKRMENNDKKNSYQPKGGILPAQDVVSAAVPMFQPRKRTTKIRKVLIPKSSKGSSTSDLPVVDLEDCKSEVMIKSDGTHIQVLRHPPSGLVLQPVSTIPQQPPPSSNVVHTSSSSNALIPHSPVGNDNTEVALPHPILSAGPVGTLTAVSKGFTITSPTVGVGYQGSRVLVQKSSSITLNHEGEEIIHCEKEGEETYPVGEEELETKEHEEMMNYEEIQTTGEEQVQDEFNSSSDEREKQEEVDNATAQIKDELDKDEDGHLLDEEDRQSDEMEEGNNMEDMLEDEDLDEEEHDRTDEGDDEDGSSKTAAHCRTSGRVRKMNPKYFHEDNIISSGEGKTPPKETHHQRKRSRTISENNSLPAFKKKK